MHPCESWREEEDVRSPAEDTEPCSACSHSKLIPTATPRGRELDELYPGATAAEQRLRPVHAVAKALVERLEGTVPATAVAGEFEKLARLVQEGARSSGGWQRANDPILGQPKDRVASAIERGSKLGRAYRSGALTESECNLTKWDLLSRVGSG